MRAPTATFFMYAMSVFLLFGTALALGFLLPNYRDQQAEISELRTLTVTLQQQLDEEKTKTNSCIQDLTLAQDVVADVKGDARSCQTNLSVRHLALTECRNELQVAKTKLNDTLLHFAALQQVYNDTTAYEAAVPQAKTDNRAAQKTANSTFITKENIGSPIIVGMALAILTVTVIALLIGYTIGTKTA